MIYRDLILGFLRVGCFAFGGAYSAIPLIRDVVLEYGWLTDEQLSYMIAVSESTPGPIMVNLATYVGNSQGGFLGAVLATTAVVLPAFVIILLIMAVMKNIIKNKYVQALLRGVKPCIVGIILATGIYMILNNAFNISALVQSIGAGAASAAALTFDFQALLLSLILGVAMFGSKPLFKKKLSPIKLIAISAVLGVIAYGI